MNMEIDEVILRNAMSRKQPMTDERLKLIFTYIMYLVAEVLGFGLAFVFILCVAGVLR